MVGTATPHLGEDTIPRPLRIVRALVLVVLGVELLSNLLLPALVSPWLYYILVTLSAAGAALALFRPLLGVTVCAVPIASALFAPFGQDIVPLLVTSVMVCAVVPVRIAGAVGLGYLAYAVASWTIAGPVRGVAVLALLLVGAGVGCVVRALWRRSGRVDLRIRRLQAQTLRLRAAERAALAEELSQLLVDGLRGEQRELVAVRSSADAATLGRVLERAHVAARDTLAQLRGLVSTLRGRDGQERNPAGVGGEGLLGVAEETEETLVGHGYPTTIELPAQLPPVGDFAQWLLGTVLREGAAVLLRQAPPGQSCAIVVTVEPSRLGVELRHPGPGAVMAEGALRDAGHRVQAAGGTFRIDVRDGSWRLQATMPVLARAAAEPAAAEVRAGRRRWPGLRRTAGLIVLGVGLAMAVRAALTWASGADDGGWWAIWSLACAGLAATAWRARYAVAIMIAVLLAGLTGVEPTSVLGQPPQLAIIVLAAVGVVHRGRWAWIMTLGWAVYCLAWFRVPSIQPATDGLFYPIVGVMVGLSTQHFKRLRSSQDRLLRSVASRYDAARDDVRRELAGELHDIVAHQLSLITMQASAYRGEADPDRLRAGIDRVAAINASAQADLALLLHVMRAPVSAAHPESGGGWLSPTTAVDAAAGTLRESGRPVRMEVEDAVDAADPTTRKTLTRIVREATTNILRYAPLGGECVIRMAADGDGVGVMIDNPLPDRPRHSTHSTGLGLIGLEERVRITGGTFAAGVVHDRWRLTARLPLTPQVDLRPRAEDEPQSDPGGSPVGSTMPSWIARIRI